MTVYHPPVLISPMLVDIICSDGEVAERSKAAAC